MPTTFSKKKNNGYSTLLSTHTSGSGTIVIQSGEQTRFPATFPFRITVYIANPTLTSPQSAGTVFFVNSSSTNTFNVTVAGDEFPTSSDQTFTTGGTYPINVELDWTYGSALEYEGAINNLETYNNTILVDMGAVNAYVITPSPAITAYASGQTFSFIPTTLNTAASTLNVNGLGAKSIQYGGQALTAQFLSSGLIAQVKYDGTNFQLLNPATRVIGYSQAVTNQGTYTSETDLTNMTATVIVPNGTRAIKISALANFQSSVADGAISFNIKEGATTLQNSNVFPGAANQPYTANTFVFLSNPTAGVHTYKCSSGRTVGSGNITMVASASIVASFEVTLE